MALPPGEGPNDFHRTPAAGRGQAGKRRTHAGGRFRPPPPPRGGGGWGGGGERPGGSPAPSPPPLSPEAGARGEESGGATQRASSGPATARSRTYAADSGPSCGPSPAAT